MEIRILAQQNNVYLYQVANKMGISEATMTRMLRNELQYIQREKILSIIKQIVAERSTEDE